MGYKNAVVAYLAPLGTPEDDINAHMDEVESLVSTYGTITVLEKIQKRAIPNYRTFIGTGKLDEIMAFAAENEVHLLIIGNILKPKQIWNMNEYFRKNKVDLVAWDRVDLILKIFQLHANSPEANLQIQLASIKHMGPRIFDMGIELDRQGWGIGTSGKGETNLEIMRRHLRQQEKNIKKKIEKYQKVRQTHRAWRIKKHIKVVGLVGYTNAGKSTLMNALTDKWVLAEDKLFATLGTSVAKMKREIDYTKISPSYRFHDILISDTIGFIRELPPSLIDAFRSTLEDSIESDLLLHVIDASDSRIGERIEVVEAILEEIGAKQKRMYVFNKIDQITKEKRKELEEEFADLNPIFVSAYKDIGVSELKEIIEGEVGYKK